MVEFLQRDSVQGFSNIKKLLNSVLSAVKTNLFGSFCYRKIPKGLVGRLGERMQEIGRNSQNGGVKGRVVCLRHWLSAVLWWQCQGFGTVNNLPPHSKQRTYTQYSVMLSTIHTHTHTYCPVMPMSAHSLAQTHTQEQRSFQSRL